MVQWLREERREGKDVQREGGVCFARAPDRSMQWGSRTTFCYMRVMSSEHIQNIPPMGKLYLGPRVKSYSAYKEGSYSEQHGGVPYVTSHPVPDKHTTHTMQISTGQRGESAELAVNMQQFCTHPFMFLLTATHRIPIVYLFHTPPSTPSVSIFAVNLGFTKWNLHCSHIEYL